MHLYIFFNFLYHIIHLDDMHYVKLLAVERELLLSSQSVMFQKSVVDLELVLHLQLDQSLNNMSVKKKLESLSLLYVKVKYKLKKTLFVK